MRDLEVEPRDLCGGDNILVVEPGALGSEPGDWLPLLGTSNIDRPRSKKRNRNKARPKGKARPSEKARPKESEIRRKERRGTWQSEKNFWKNSRDIKRERNKGDKCTWDMRKYREITGR